MREIKFRAWDKSIKSFVPMMQWIEELKDAKFRILGKETVTKSHNISNLAVLLKSCNVEITQYTGLKDVDEKEIYEGDIVKVFERMAGEDFIGKVIYDETEGCYWIMQGNERNHCKITFDLEDYSHYVIGNIYENSELLD